MTVLAVLSQAASIALMWRIWKTAGAGPKTRRSNREGKERSSS